VTVRSRALVIASLIALVVAGCGGPEEPAPPPRPPTVPGILFADDFESGSIEAWHNQSCSPDRVTVYTSADQPTWPAPPQGDRAVRLLAYDGDVEPGQAVTRGWRSEAADSVDVRGRSAAPLQP
jgi:hypothetical protein